MRTGNSHRRSILAGSFGPSDHKAQHGFIREAVFATTMVDPMDHVISMQPLPRTPVADMVCQTTVQQRANRKLLCSVLPRRRAFFAQGQRPQLINHVVELGDAGHGRRLPHHTRNHDRLVGNQIIRGVRFGLGLLDIRLEFVVDGSEILAGDEIGQDQPAVAFEDGDYVFGGRRCGDLREGDGWYVGWVNGWRECRHLLDGL